MNSLSMRDTFALFAMHALLIKYGEKLPSNEDTDGGEYADIAISAYSLADCMLMERKGEFDMNEQAERAPVERTVRPICADCGGPIGEDDGPSDGWQFEDGRTVCHKCCVSDFKQLCEKLIVLAAR